MRKLTASIVLAWGVAVAAQQAEVKMKNGVINKGEIKAAYSSELLLKPEKMDVPITLGYSKIDAIITGSDTLTGEIKQDQVQAVLDKIAEQARPAPTKVQPDAVQPRTATKDDLPVDTTGLGTELAKKHKLVFPFVSWGVMIGYGDGGLAGPQLGFHPMRWFSVFGDLRYYKNHITYNAGVKGYVFHPDELEGLRPFVKAMFGVSHVVYVENSDSLNKMFHGPTVGLGTEFRFDEYRKRAFTVCFNIIPLESQKYVDHIAQISNYQKPLPVVFEFGYHHTF